jgi:hypothetical protein
MVRREFTPLVADIILDISKDLLPETCRRIGMDLDEAIPVVKGAAIIEADRLLRDLRQHANFTNPHRRG